MPDAEASARVEHGDLVIRRSTGAVVIRLALTPAQRTALAVMLVHSPQKDTPCA